MRRGIKKEVAVCAQLLGVHVRVQEDVGVAGLHRLAPEAWQATSLHLKTGHPLRWSPPEPLKTPGSSAASPFSEQALRLL